MLFYAGHFFQVSATWKWHKNICRERCRNNNKKGTMTGNGQMQEQWRDRGQMQKYDGKVISRFMNKAEKGRETDAGKWRETVAGKWWETDAGNKPRNSQMQKFWGEALTRNGTDLSEIIKNRTRERSEWGLLKNRTRLWRVWHGQCWDPWHFGANADPDPRFRPSDYWIRIRLFLHRL